MDIILSIHPKHAKNIYAGRKKYEYRTQMPKKIEPGDFVWLYETAPVQKITGYFVFEGLVSHEFDILLSMTHRVGCVTQEELKSYYRRKIESGEICSAMCVGEFIKLHKPIIPDWKCPPQNFIYGSGAYHTGYEF